MILPGRIENLQHDPSLELTELGPEQFADPTVCKDFEAVAHGICFLVVGQTNQALSLEPLVQGIDVVPGGLHGFRGPNGDPSVIPFVRLLDEKSLKLLRIRGRERRSGPIELVASLGPNAELAECGAGIRRHVCGGHVHGILDGIFDLSSIVRLAGSFQKTFRRFARRRESRHDLRLEFGIELAVRPFDQFTGAVVVHQKRVQRCQIEVFDLPNLRILDLSDDLTPLRAAKPLGVDIGVVFRLRPAGETLNVPLG